MKYIIKKCMGEKKRTITKWLYWFLFAVAVILVYKTLDNFAEIGIWLKGLLEVLMPFIIGIFIAYILYIPSRKIENLYAKVKRPKIIAKKVRLLSVFTVYFITIILLVIAFRFLLPVIANSVIDLVNNFQGYYNSMMQNMESLPEDSFLKSDIVLEIVNSIKNIDFRQLINMDMLAQYAKGAISMVTKIFDFFVAIVVSVYILLQRKEILEFAKKFGKAIFKESTYKNAGRYFYRTNEIFFNFLAGQFIDGIVVGIITSIGMSILGVKYAVLLGFMIGLFNMIPYFGAIIAVIVATLITILTGGIAQAVTMVIVVTILQQIDANIINPKIMSNSLKISPLLVIFAVTMGGAYFGVLGMFLAVPIIAVLKLFVTDYIEYKNRIRMQEEKEIIG